MHCVSAAFARDLCWTVCMCCSFVSKSNESKKSMVAQYSSPLFKYKEKTRNENESCRNK